MNAALLSPVCSLCQSNDRRGMVLRLDTEEHLCRRCISDGQRAEILSLKTYYDCRSQTDLQASLQREQAVKLDLAAANSKLDVLDQQLNDMKSALDLQTVRVQQAKKDRQAIEAELQSELRRIKESKEALSAKHQLACHRASKVNAELAAQHDALFASHQSVERMEVGLQAAQAIASQQLRLQKLLEDQLAEKENSITLLRGCNSQIVKRLKQSQQDISQLVSQKSDQPLPNGSLMMYIKELQPGKFVTCHAKLKYCS